MERSLSLSLCRVVSLHAEGSPSMRHMSTAASPRVTGFHGEKHDGEVPVVIDSSTSHWTGALKYRPSSTSPKPAIPATGVVADIDRATTTSAGQMRAAHVPTRHRPELRTSHNLPLGLGSCGRHRPNGLTANARWVGRASPSFAVASGATGSLLPASSAHG